VHGGAEAPHLVFAFRGLEKDDVGPFRLEVAAARQGFVKTMHRAGVRPCHDQDIDVGSRFHGSPDLHARLVTRDHLLAAGVAAFLGVDLVFDHHSRGTGTGIFDHRALDIQRVAVTSVTIADQRNLRSSAATVAQAVQHLAE
jgi:hypothetical protein